MSGPSQRQGVMVLNAVPGLGPVRISRLLDAFAGSAAAVLEAPASALRQVEGIGPETSAAIVSWRSHFDLDREEEQLARIGADYILKGEAGYPERLAELPGAPLGLYIRGCVTSCPSVAIVGTRRATLYGRRVARTFATELARAGICVVSGLARGIDGEAHEGALVTGRTLAFLGCGLDVDYPPEHAELAQRISQSGAVISEYYLGRKPDAQTFPQRNRLISGSADAILVVESDVKGGSMITASFAAEQGRMVFAVPGRIDQPSSRGCHALIRDGATLAACAQDIIDEIRHQFPRRAIKTPIGAARPEQTELGICAAPPLSDDERKVLGALEDGAVLHPDAICRICVMAQPAVMSALMMLELKRLVARRPDASYEAQGRASR